MINLSEQNSTSKDVQNIVVKQESVYGLLSKLLEKLIDKCVVTHFKITLFTVCITVIITTAIIYGANFSIAINLADDIFVKNSIDLIFAAGTFLCGGLLFVILNKVISIKQYIVDANMEKDKMNDIILTQFNMVRQDFSGFVTTLENFKSSNRNIFEMVDMLSKLISEDIIDTKRIIHVLASVYSAIKNHPSKATIIDLLTIRSKLLTVNMIELVNEYFALLAPTNPENSNLVFNLDGNARAKNQFVMDKLNSMFKDIKKDYISEVYELSKNTIDHSVNLEIENILDKLYDRVVEYMFGNERIPIQEIIFYIIEDVKKMTIEIEQLFTKSINIESIFDSIKDSDDDSEGDDE